jgi:hypothetical protein
LISELHRQQSILLYAKTRSIPDRIVNLVQQQVRPIVRGKARAVVEFGAKNKCLRAKLLYPSA